MYEALNQTVPKWTMQSQTKPHCQITMYKQKTEQSTTYVNSHNLLFGTLSIILFFKEAFPFSGKEAPNLVDPYIKIFSVTAHHTSSNLLRYATENRPSTRVVTGKWLLKN
jgi:hypothetical protein